MLVVGALATACGSDDGSSSSGPGGPGDPGGDAAQDTVAAGSSTLTAPLAGGTPGADPDGLGTAYVGVDPAASRVCVDIRLTGVGPLAGVEVRQGQATAGAANGPPAVAVTPPTLTDDGRGCSTVAADLLERLGASPTDFYVEVRTADFPAGAVRGQLRR